MKKKIEVIDWIIWQRKAKFLRKLKEKKNKSPQKCQKNLHIF